MTETKECKIIAGKCSHCKKKLDMKITDVEDENNKIIGWLIYGICKKIKTIFMMAFFHQEEKPIENVDFMIDYNLVCKTTKSPFKSEKK